MTDDAGVTELGLTAWHAFWGVRQDIDAVLESQLTRFAQVSTADYGILVALNAGGAARVGDLATAISWERSRLSHHLGRMEKRGLVSRQPDVTDRRGVVVRIAEPGQALLASATPVYMEFLGRGVLAALSDQDFEMIIELVSRLKAHLAAYRAELDATRSPASPTAATSL